MTPRFDERIVTQMENERERVGIRDSHLQSNVGQAFNRAIKELNLSIKVSEVRETRAGHYQIDFEKGCLSEDDRTKLKKMVSEETKIPQERLQIVALYF